LPEDDPWRRCGQTEQWLANSEGLPPPKSLGNCRRAIARPRLDGRLDEAIWTSADSLRLRSHRSTDGSKNSAKVCFAYDNEFLYLAVNCPKEGSIDYSPDDRPRPRDADLSRRDRVTVRLDIDRDYTTAFELSVDHRGWTHDSCWGDTTWDPTWFVAAASDDLAWTAEVAIPLVELANEAPAARHVWAVAVERSIPGRIGETWSGNVAEDESPDMFGMLIFE
jgi:hypothetical protein